MVINIVNFDHDFHFVRCQVYTVRCLHINDVFGHIFPVQVFGSCYHTSVSVYTEISTGIALYEWVSVTVVYISVLSFKFGNIRSNWGILWDMICQHIAVEERFFINDVSDSYVHLTRAFLWILSNVRGCHMKYIIAFEFSVEARVHDDITCKREGAYYLFWIWTFSYKVNFRWKIMRVSKGKDILLKGDYNRARDGLLYDSLSFHQELSEDWAWNLPFYRPVALLM